MLLRQLPPVHTLLETAQARALAGEFSRNAMRETIQERLAQIRQSVLDAAVSQPALFSTTTFFDEVRRLLEDKDLARLRRVINATGIVIHTNMGRAPLAVEAAEAVRDLALHYSNLELDLATGKRGSRGARAETLLCELTGAEAALVVNNNAAAVLLCLSTLAKGGEVLISRGELVEIGGAFRIPDVIRQSDARLVEVGTTNKTRMADYERALTPETRVILKVHTSNYRIIGFVEEVKLPDLVGLGASNDLIVIKDLGSGALVDLTRFGLPYEPTVAETMSTGVDIATFSGDKLLGGPQCGIILGKREYIRQMSGNPLFRALRADKLSLGALEATLGLYREEERLRDSLPVLRMLSQDKNQLTRRARRLRAKLSKIPGWEVRLDDGVGFAGGGALPERGMPTKLLKVRSTEMSVERLADALRRNDPPVMGMLAGDCFVMDMRTVRDQEIGEIAEAFRGILS